MIKRIILLYLLLSPFVFSQSIRYPLENTDIKYGKELRKILATYHKDKYLIAKGELKQIRIRKLRAFSEEEEQQRIEKEEQTILDQKINSKKYFFLCHQDITLKAIDSKILSIQDMIILDEKIPKIIQTKFFGYRFPYRKATHAIEYISKDNLILFTLIIAEEHKLISFLPPPIVQLSVQTEFHYKINEEFISFIKKATINKPSSSE